jgi:hypothetical protein
MDQLSCEGNDINDWARAKICALKGCAAGKHEANRKAFLRTMGLIFAVPLIASRFEAANVQYRTGEAGILVDGAQPCCSCFIQELVQPDQLSPRWRMRRPCFLLLPKPVCAMSYGPSPRNLQGRQASQ